jgi:hypothetical protein
VNVGYVGTTADTTTSDKQAVLATRKSHEVPLLILPLVVISWCVQSLGQLVDVARQAPEDKHLLALR